MGSVDLSLPLRIPIPEFDAPLPNKKARFQGYGGVFKYLI
jgi:hypothetical protein